MSSKEARKAAAKVIADKAAAKVVPPVVTVPTTTPAVPATTTPAVPTTATAAPTTPTTAPVTVGDSGPIMPTMPAFMANGKGPATMSECKLMSAYITSMEKFSRATTETTAKIANVEKDELVKTAGTFLKDSPQFSGYSSEFSTTVSNFLNGITGNRAGRPSGDTEKERGQAIAHDCYRIFGTNSRKFEIDSLEKDKTFQLQWGLKHTRVAKTATEKAEAAAKKLRDAREAVELADKEAAAQAAMVLLRKKEEAINAE